MMAAEYPIWFIRFFAFGFGAIWGSFFNVAIHRWPLDMSVVSPPSHCPACKEPIRAGRNIPILGYIFLRGRAACCGVKITPRYLVVEVISAVICMALAEHLIINAPMDTPMSDAAIEAGTYFIFCGALIIATFTDLRWMIIPDEVTLAGTAVGLATVGFRASPGASDAAIGAGLGFLIVQMIFVYGYERLTGRRGMGEGDAKLLMLIGAFIGWRGMLFALAAGATQGVVAAGILMATGKMGAASAVPSEPGTEPDSEQESPDESDESDDYSDESDDSPTPFGQQKIKFGPFLALGALEFLFFGDAIISAYIDLVF